MTDTHAVVRRDGSVSFSMDDIERMGAAIAESKLFGMQNTQQAVALMLIAQAEGKHPAVIARDYHIIQGRPAKKAESMLRDFMEAGGTVKWHQMDDEKSDATFSHPSGGSVRVDWDMARADRAGLLNKGGAWKQYPRAMMRSRVISEGVRAVCPAATSGLYVPEEVSQFDGGRAPLDPDDVPEPTEPDPPAPRPLDRAGLIGAMTMRDVPQKIAEAMYELWRKTFDADPDIEAHREFMARTEAREFDLPGARLKVLLAMWTRNESDEALRDCMATVIASMDEKPDVGKGGKLTTRGYEHVALWIAERCGEPFDQVVHEALANDAPF